MKKQTNTFKTNYFGLVSKANLVFGIIAISAISCSKPEDGKPGADGVAGTNGTNGNANVTQYNFASRTFTGATSYQIPNFTHEKLDNSVVLCYYNSGTIWYILPGIGVGASYTTRSFYEVIATNLNIRVELLNVNLTTYASPVTFLKFKVIVIPNSVVINLKSASKPNFHKMSYTEVCNYLNISE